jgi:hypothetical protein
MLFLLIGHICRHVSLLTGQTGRHESLLMVTLAAMLSLLMGHMVALLSLLMDQMGRHVVPAEHCVVPISHHLSLRMGTESCHVFSLLMSYVGRNDISANVHVMWAAMFSLSIFHVGPPCFHY